jgi:hypothetical protein
MAQGCQHMPLAVMIDNTISLLFSSELLVVEEHLMMWYACLMSG